MEIVGVRGERVRLVPQDREKHLDNYVRWLNDPDVTRYIGRNLPLTRMQEEEWFQRLVTRENDVVWAVEDETGRHIGSTGLHRIDWKERSAVIFLILWFML